FFDTARKKDLFIQLGFIQINIDRYKTRFNNIVIMDWQVFVAARLEIYRLMTLGIVGFDNPLTLKSMQESATALGSVQKALDYYPESCDPGNLNGKFEGAIRFLSAHTDFSSFNRMDFITAYCNPLTIGIAHREKKLQIHVIKYNRLLNQDAKTLFDTNTFNVNAYAPDRSAFLTKEKILLGEKLFSDAT